MRAVFPDGGLPVAPKTRVTACTEESASSEKRRWWQGEQDLDPAVLSLGDNSMSPERKVEGLELLRFKIMIFLKKNQVFLYLKMCHCEQK